MPNAEQRLISNGAEAIGDTLETFKKSLRTELERQGKVVKGTGAQLD